MRQRVCLLQESKSIRAGEEEEKEEGSPRRGSQEAALQEQEAEEAHSQTRARADGGWPSSGGGGCARKITCMNSAQIGQEENVVLRAAVEATDTSTQQTKNFPTCLSQAQQIAATRAGCHGCTPFVLFPCTPVCFGGCSNELAMAQARAVIAWD